MKSIIRNFVPPIMLSMIQRLYGEHKNCFKGDYPSWQAALDASEGYDAPAILERVREAALKVKHGEAVFERDSVCFDYEEYRWATLACLLRIAAEHGGVLRVLDFGGALGSFYFQHKQHFNNLKQVRWAVVEQQHYVQCGRDEFQNNVLQFYDTIEDCLAKGKCDIIFCSSVLEYIEDPYMMLNEFSKSGIEYILLDRTPFIDAEQDRLTVQTVPKAIYSASYPAWFLSSSVFIRELQLLGLNKIVEFDGDDDVGIGEFKGVLLARS